MITRTGRRTGDNGVSESIGFLLIFTMVIVGIGLVTLYGYPLLLQQQTSADRQIMQKNMIVLQNDMKSLAYKTVPFKETSLNIGSGSLTAYDFVTHGPTFTISDTTGTLLQTKTGDLRYYSSASGGEISLQNGAVVNRNLVEVGSSMLSQPRWFYDSQTGTMVVNLIRVNTTEQTLSRSGIGDLQMELGEPLFASYTTAGAATLHNPVSVMYTEDSGQDYYLGWQNYFEKSMDMTCSWSSPSLTCSFNKPITTLVIKRTDVNIRSI